MYPQFIFTFYIITLEKTTTYNTNISKHELIKSGQKKCTIRTIANDSAI